jgi:hypothetical protein
MKKSKSAVLVPSLTYVDLGGLHRGGQHAMETITAWNRDSPTATLGVNGFDLNPNRVHDAVGYAASSNLSLIPRHGRVQDFVAAEGANAAGRPIIIAVDDARSGAEVCAMCAAFGRALLLYLIIRLPNKQLVGLTAVLRMKMLKRRWRSPPSCSPSPTAPSGKDIAPYSVMRASPNTSSASRTIASSFART